MNETMQSHDKLVDLVSRAITLDEAIDPNGDVASVSRDLIASGAPVKFGNEVTGALNQGLNSTPNDPDADFMALRYNQPIADVEGRNGQITILTAAIGVARNALSLLTGDDSETGELRDHITGRIAEFEQTIARMRTFLASGENVRERDSEQVRQFFVQSVLRRIALYRAQGKAVTGFTSEPTYADKDGEAKLHVRAKDNPFELRESGERIEHELKFSLKDPKHVQELLDGDPDSYPFEDHEQVYLFVAEGEGELPPYEFRVRKITRGKDVEFVGTIKCGTGEKRAEFEFNMDEALYETFKANRLQGYNIVNKRRYVLGGDQDQTTTVDRLEIDGKVDYSAEVEFRNPDAVERFHAPSWMGERRKDRKYSMQRIARDGITW